MFICVEKEMHRIPHEGIIAQKLLEERLKKHCCCQSDKTPGLWKHDTRPICFSLIFDDFGVKYFGKEHADHIVGVLREFYDVDKDREGTKYCWVTLDRDYIKRQIHPSMPCYCDEGSTRFQHELQKII